MNEHEIERLVVRLIGDSTSYQNMMQEAKRSVDQVSQTVRTHTSGLIGLQNTVKGIMGTMLQWGTMMAGFAGITGIIGTGMFGLKLAKDAESAEIAFTSLLKSEQKAKELLKDLFDFAAKTPFQFPELKTAAKSLLSAGFAAKDIIPMMQTLGDVTASMGTGAEGIQRATYALQQMRGMGRIMGGEMMQLNNAGIPAQKILAAALGKSSEEVMKMARNGQLGKKEVEKFFDAFKTGKGVENLLGGMAAQSKTLDGLWSTLKDDIGGALTEISTQLIKALGIKDIVANTSILVQRYKQDLINGVTGFISFTTPYVKGFGAVWQAMTMMIIRGFDDLYRFISRFFQWFGEATGVTFKDVQTVILGTFITAEYAFNEFEALTQYVWLSVLAGALQVFGEITHFFTGTMPAILTWFGKNFQDVFYTAFDYVTTLFINFGQNVRSNMRAIWDFISSGGTARLELAWIPLEKGFINTIKRLPNLPKREIGELEKQIKAEAAALGAELNVGFEEFHAKRMKELLPDLDGVEEATKGLGEELGKSLSTSMGGELKKTEQFAAALVGSKEASAHIQEYIQGAERKDAFTPQQNQLKVAQDSKQKLGEIATNLEALKIIMERSLSKDPIEIKQAGLASG